MADVFVSYKRENSAAVQRLVQALRAAGLTVWWDYDIAPDAPWEAAIERELNAAKVVIVAWSKAAVASDNVRAEARHARKLGRLIQVFVEPCEPPLFFGERQGVDLSAWNGDVANDRFQTVVTAARAVLAGERPPAGVGYVPPASRGMRPWTVFTVVALVLAAVVIVANVYFRLSPQPAQSAQAEPAQEDEVAPTAPAPKAEPRQAPAQTVVREAPAAPPEPAAEPEPAGPQRFSADAFDGELQPCFIQGASAVCELWLTAKRSRLLCDFGDATHLLDVNGAAIPAASMVIGAEERTVTNWGYHVEFVEILPGTRMRVIYRFPAPSGRDQIQALVIEKCPRGARYTITVRPVPWR